MTLILLCLVVFTISLTNVDAKSCPAGFEHRGDFCYLYVTEPKDWVKAGDYCHDLGPFVYLAHPRTEAENNEIIDIVGDNKGWLGGSDSLKEGEWIWENDASVLEWTDWARGQPDNWKNQDCQDICPTQCGYSKGSWDDRPCDKPLPFICQTIPQCDAVAKFPSVPTLAELDKVLELNNVYNFRRLQIRKALAKTQEDAIWEKCCGEESNYDCTADRGWYPPVFYHLLNGVNHICWVKKGWKLLKHNSVTSCSCQECITAAELTSDDCTVHGCCEVQQEDKNVYTACYPVEEPFLKRQIHAGVGWITISVGSSCKCLKI